MNLKFEAQLLSLITILPSSYWAIFLSYPVKFYYNQIEIKRFYRFLRVREWYHSFNTSGFYDKNRLSLCAKDCNLSYNTLRVDLKQWNKEGILSIHGNKLRFHALSGSNKTLFRHFQTFRADIIKAKNPALHFCNIIKTKHFFTYMYAQGLNEANKIQDQKIRRKYLRTVKNSKTSLGVNTGMNVSINTIGRIFGKSKTTGHKYVEQMQKAKLLTVNKHYEPLCNVEDFSLRLRYQYINRTVTNYEEGIVYERKQNSYRFF